MSPTPFPIARHLFPTITEFCADRSITYTLYLRNYDLGLFEFIVGSGSDKVGGGECNPIESDGMPHDGAINVCGCGVETSRPGRELDLER